MGVRAACTVCKANPALQRLHVRAPAPSDHGAAWPVLDAARGLLGAEVQPSRDGQRLHQCCEVHNSGGMAGTAAPADLWRIVTVLTF